MNGTSHQVSARLERRLLIDSRGVRYMRKHGTVYREGVKLRKKQRAAARRAQ